MVEERKYGSWGGNSRGTPEDKTRCIESVINNSRAGISHQCGRKRGFGEDGLYCRQHDPAAIKAKRAAQTKAYEDMWKRRALEEKIERQKQAVCDAVINEFDLGGLSVGSDLYKATDKLKKTLSQQESE